MLWMLTLSSKEQKTYFIALTLATGHRWPMSNLLDHFYSRYDCRVVSCRVVYFHSYSPSLFWMRWYGTDRNERSHTDSSYRPVVSATVLQIGETLFLLSVLRHSISISIPFSTPGVASGGSAIEIRTNRLDTTQTKQCLPYFLCKRYVACIL